MSSSSAHDIGYIFGCGLAYDYLFREEDHPLDDDGKFTDKASINAEYAPSPNDKKGNERWGKLTEAEKFSATMENMTRLVSKLNEENGDMLGKPVSQRGGWLGNLNDSCAIPARDADSAVRLGKTIGENFNQQSVYVTSLSPDSEGVLSETPTVFLSLKGFTPKQVDEVYNAIHKACGTDNEDDRNKVKGMSFSSRTNVMSIGLTDCDNPKELYGVVKKALQNSSLSGRISGYLGTAYSALIKTGG